MKLILHSNACINRMRSINFLSFSLHCVEIDRTASLRFISSAVILLSSISYTLHSHFILFLFYGIFFWYSIHLSLLSAFGVLSWGGRGVYLLLGVWKIVIILKKLTFFSKDSIKLTVTSPLSFFIPIKYFENLNR